MNRNRTKIEYYKLGKKDTAIMKIMNRKRTETYFSNMERKGK